MNFDKALNIAGMIVVLAGVSVIVSSPRTAGIINAIGGSFSGAINAATRPSR